MTAAHIIAILGAECTGKSTLAKFLCQELAKVGVDAVVVPEALRSFCDVHGRAPEAEEQPALAQVQSDAIASASGQHAVVLADTTALMTAMYSDLYFNDPGLFTQAARAHRACHLTLLTGLDLPWVADGIQRDSPRMRETADARLRGVLLDQEIPFSVVYGQGPLRERAALAAVWRCLRPPHDPPATPRWRWTCPHCSDGSGEAAERALRRCATEAGGPWGR